MKNTSRALRRHHVNRLRKARADYWGRELDARQLGMVIAAPKGCSCWMCNNPRKSKVDDHPNGITFQEHKQLDFFRSSLAELLDTDKV